jgi:hypothetical protein
MGSPAEPIKEPQRLAVRATAKWTTKSLRPPVAEIISGLVPACQRSRHAAS